MEQLNSILNIGIQYPYLEMDDFTNSWTIEKVKSNDKAEA
jgi:hypothetical protein